MCLLNLGLVEVKNSNSNDRRGAPASCHPRSAQGASLLPATGNSPPLKTANSTTVTLAGWCLPATRKPAIGSSPTSSPTTGTGHPPLQVTAPRCRWLRLKLPPSQLTIFHPRDITRTLDRRMRNEEWDKFECSRWFCWIVGRSKFQSIETATDSFWPPIPSLLAREYQMNEINQRR
jgi:hypothetical protein